jgi:predicted GNAT family N-acyltransferase
MQLNIRFVLPTELPILYALRQEVLRKPLGLDLYTQDFSAEKKWLSIGAFNEDNLVGCVMLSTINETTIQLRQMAVSIAFQGNGIGNQLLCFVQNYCVQNIISTIILHARKNAIPFYKQFGFTVIGDEYLEVGLPHFSMQKSINVV